MNNIDDDYNENEDIDYYEFNSMNSMNILDESAQQLNTYDLSNINTNDFILPMNKGFMLLHEEFIQNGWIMSVNEQNRLVYTKKENNCDEFIILINKKNNINVTIPVANSNIAYSTTFNSYFCACEFITMHIKNYELSFTSSNT